MDGKLISVTLFAVFTIFLFFCISCDEESNEITYEPEPTPDYDIVGGVDLKIIEEQEKVNSADRPGLHWDWIPVEGAVCRDGSPTGIGIRRADGSDKLAIFLLATGICAFAGQCDNTFAHFDEEDFKEVIDEYLYQGLFNPNEERNPLQDWNWVFVPGCTGDMFAGNKPDAFAFGIDEPQQFVGYQNMELSVEAMQRLFGTDLSQIFLWGYCSGGNGALVTYPLVADAFEGVPVTMLNDSGPIPAMDEAFSPCMQILMRWMFNIGPSIPPDCLDCTLSNGDGLSNIQTYLAQKYPYGNFGLMNFMADEDLRLAWGYGQYACLAFLLGNEDYIRLPAWTFREALIDLRDNYLLPTNRWSTFFIEGDVHTFYLIYDWVYDEELNNTALLLDWLEELIDGNVPDSIGPIF